MAWRVANSLLKYRDQLNAAHPNRSKVSDGFIGDAAHATRDSDHNPWVVLAGMGIVTAGDFTHDPANGVDCEKLYQALVKSRDPRIKYIIWNRTITSGNGQTLPWVRRPYTGTNPHTKHLHMSVQSSANLFDDSRPWALPGDGGFPIVGGIRMVYDRMPGLLGQPKGPEVPTLDWVGRWQEFAGGVVYWHPDTGAHEVHGAILAEWRRIGSELVTGYPVTDEIPCPDTRGRYNQFAAGWSIYWHPDTGAHPVHGGFRSWWAANGWERGKLGYPLSDEYVAKDGRVTQDFQGGKLVMHNGVVIFIAR